MFTLISCLISCHLPTSMQLAFFIAYEYNTFLHLSTHKPSSMFSSCGYDNEEGSSFVYPNFLLKWIEHSWCTMIFFTYYFLTFELSCFSYAFGSLLLGSTGGQQRSCKWHSEGNEGRDSDHNLLHQIYLYLLFQEIDGLSPCLYN
jgi:hypothetical protein